jgi:hypothetical protein
MTDPREHHAVHSRTDERCRRWLITSVGVLAIGCLVLSACADEAGSKRGAPPTPGPTSTATDETGEGIDESPGAGSLLTRRDAPPAGVARQFEYFEVGNGVCYQTPDATGPAILTERDGVATDVAEIADYFYACLHGFDRGNVTLQLLFGESVVATERVETFGTDGPGVWPWRPLPGRPLGQYDISATQGSVQASASFTLTRPSSPTVLVLPDPECLSPGSSLQAYVGGFQPGSQIALHLYKERTAGQFDYLTSLDLEVNEFGEATVPLPTEGGDNAGRYFLRYQVGAKSWVGDAFCLER